MHHVVTVHIIYRLSGEDKTHRGSSIGKPEGRKTPGSPRQSWKGDIKIYLKVTGQGGVVCINLLRDRRNSWVLVNMVTNLRVS